MFNTTPSLHVNLAHSAWEKLFRSHAAPVFGLTSFKTQSDTKYALSPLHRATQRRDRSQLLSAGIEDSHPRPANRGLMMRVERTLRSGFSLAILELLLSLTFKGDYHDRRLGGEFTLVFHLDLDASIAIVTLRFVWTPLPPSLEYRAIVLRHYLPAFSLRVLKSRNYETVDSVIIQLGFTCIQSAMDVHQETKQILAYLVAALFCGTNWVAMLKTPPQVLYTERSKGLLGAVDAAAERGGGGLGLGDDAIGVVGGMRVDEADGSEEGMGPHTKCGPGAPLRENGVYNAILVLIEESEAVPVLSERACFRGAGLPFIYRYRQIP
ncbi:hypothetical protein B0H14DRAFT_2592118 [Mycena olivaceomarginata]|nr:hypothetical protein B0H14DRAFT_2592118 [Mycena olivaceomarginata]